MAFCSKKVAIHHTSPLWREALRDMITTDSFSAIAETAALKGLDALARCCAAFGAKTAEVQAMLRLRLLFFLFGGFFFFRTEGGTPPK